MDKMGVKFLSSAMAPQPSQQHLLEQEFLPLYFVKNLLLKKKSVMDVL